MGETIEFGRPDGKRAPGYAVESNAGNPGVVMLEEWWGVTAQVRETADRLGACGFNVLVPDLFRGRAAATGDEANHLMQGLDFTDAATQDAVGAATYLRERGAKKTGVMGFCMGGALALLAMMHTKSFDAASIWYGFPPEEAGDPGTISVPLQGHWGTRDGFFPIARVDAIEASLRRNKADFEFFRYDAEHGFYNPNEEGQAGLGHYSREAAELAWQRTIDFFKNALA